ncbi:DUF418 domain-containing protein [Runella sp. MFBS21]|uniref:DUF418 domain-containing protein n=1 Tax=Runella sp. MFBS21 TaxID=3034018 RepID=UPI0023F86CCF|nr:DUF418 domain-containing protein [Runella sp. MFBS21]MDF7819961.1 DUF418 domain-containing protein [Runella sp. MFBS21]
MNSIINSNPTNRVATIDFIRGIALLGILFINVQTYALFAFLRPQQVYTLGLDRPDSYAPTQFFIHLLVKGQFYTIYSFLFGLGFYLMSEKNTHAGLNTNRLFKRRLWILLALGLLHAFIFWFGDVLHKYALLGFTLLYFRKKSVAVLGKWIIGLAVSGIVIQIVQALAFPSTPAALAAGQKQFDAVVMQVVATWQHGSVWEVMSLQSLGVAMLHVMAFQHGLAGYLHYEIMFLLGLMAGKLHLFNRLTEVKNQFLRMAFLLFPMGLILKGIAGLPVFEVHLPNINQLTYEPLIISLADFLGTPLLTVVYLIEISLIFTRYPSRITGWIANAGRLGLTNYLMQTLLCMGLFYGYSLGFSGRLTLLESLGVAVAIYVFQIVYSNLWLMYYRQGPLEWLWRKLTYGKERAKAISSPDLIKY